MCGTRFDLTMKKIALLSVVGSLAGAAFVAGVAVGKVTPQPKFVAAEEIKWDDVGGPKMGALTGDYKKGQYGALMKLQAGFTSPLHLHTGAYEAIEISGTTSHWLKGEDGTKAKKMTPGSYWSMPAKLEHVSACAPGADCVFYVWQKSKFDFAVAKETPAPASSAAKPATAATGSATGSAAKPASAPAAPAAKPAGTTTGSAAPAKK
jgi:Domain of unknown function (DUF4437)